MKKIIMASALAAAFCSLSAHAAPDEYIYPARVEAGEREIDIKFGTRNMRDNSKNRSAGSIGLGYGVNEHWFTEVYVKYNNEPGTGTEYDALEWENRFQLTETGRFPVDVGFLLEVERPKNRAEGYEFKWGPLFQTDIGQTEWIANFLFERNYRSEEPSRTTSYYQLQGRYRVKKEFAFGFQAFGDLGRWDHWAKTKEQGHRIGPAIFGKIALDSHQALKYNAAYLMGRTRIDDAAYRGNTFRMQLEYEF